MKSYQIPVVAPTDGTPPGATTSAAATQPTGTGSQDLSVQWINVGFRPEVAAEINVWSTITHELCRQVFVHCEHRGALLSRARARFLQVVQCVCSSTVLSAHESFQCRSHFRIFVVIKFYGCPSSWRQRTSGVVAIRHQDERSGYVASVSCHVCYSAVLLH